MKPAGVVEISQVVQSVSRGTAWIFSAKGTTVFPAYKTTPRKKFFPRDSDRICIPLQSSCPIVEDALTSNDAPQVSVYPLEENGFVSKNLFGNTKALWTHQTRA